MEHRTRLTRPTLKPASRAAFLPDPRAQNSALPAKIAVNKIAADIQLAPAALGEAREGRVEVVEAYFDAAGLPIKRKGLGAARVARRYDAQGHQVEEAYFNAEGKPTARDDLGAARISWRYDDDGKRVGEALFGIDGAPLGARRRRKRDFKGV